MLTESVNSDLLEKVSADSGLTTMLRKLPKKYDTFLEKWVDETGYIPSGGEEQRIAIARACYHDGQVYLLDEPTAALDPNAEYEIYSQFSEMIHRKCAVLITHRLSAVQLADKVAVFDNGKIIEYGTHESLMNDDGKYADMFRKQSQFYKS